MARKRGGLAGFYDRNKGILQKLAPIAAGAIGGPMAGAAVGAAMRGLDRPGKSGIGFDIGEGVRGGVSGYMGGQMGQAARSGIQGLLTARKLDSLAPVDMASKIGITPGTTAGGFTPPSLPTNAFDLAVKTRPPMDLVPGTGPQTLSDVVARNASRTATAPAQSAVRAATPSVSAAAGPVGPLASSPVPAPQGMLNRSPSLETINRSMGATPKPNPSDALKNKEGPFGRFAEQFRKNKDIIEMVGKYAMPPRESQADLMRAETDRRQQEAQQRFYEFQMQQTRDAEARDLERRRAVLQFLSPYIRQNAPLLNPSAFGMEG